MLPLLLFLLCQSQTTFHAPGPMCRIVADGGTVYYEVCGTNRIRSTDGSFFFLPDAVMTDWTVDRGVVVFSTLHGITIVEPDGTRRVIPNEAGMQQLRVRDGFVYWLDSFEGAVRRVPLSGGAIETVADNLAIDGVRVSYAIFDGRLVLATPAGLFVKPLAGGALALLVPRNDIDTIAGVSDDGILITASSGDINGSRAQLLRVPWLGAPVETLYEASRTPGIRSTLTLAARQAGATIYLSQYATTGCCDLRSTVLVLRDGVARPRYSAFGRLQIVDADGESVTVAQWIGASGNLLLEKICAAAQRARAVSR